VFDQSHGLRFDIYERIHLPAELPGIAELEEVELLPDIQVIQREDRAELYGQLLLTGLYRSEDDRTQRLEHAIPVEITVPLTRVSSLEDIGVEIENFDIDLLTMRTVNITGVLSLRGIGGVEAVPAWQEEEYTVAYSPSEEQRTTQTAAEAQLEGDPLYENSLWTFGEGAEEDASIEERETAEAGAGHPAFSGTGSVAFDDSAAQGIPSAHTQEKEQEPRLYTHSLNTPSPSQFGEPLSGGASSGSTDNWLNSSHWNRERSEAGEPVSQEQVGNATSISASDQETAEINSGGHIQQLAQAEATLQEVAEAEAEAEPVLAAEVLVSQEAEIPAEEKQDLKVALGSKKEEGAKEKEHLTFSSLLSSSKTRKEQEALLAEESAAETISVPEAGNDTEWKSRFIGSSASANLFRKVKLCIVQREETLDTIAEKYQVSARELGLYNRLSGQSVEQGQVLYIP
jgi:stage VI sporulation protein D